MLIESLKPMDIPQEPLAEGLMLRPKRLPIGELIIAQQVFFGPVRDSYLKRDPTRVQVESELELRGASQPYIGSIEGCVASEFEDLLIAHDGEEHVIPAGVFGVNIIDSSSKIASLFRFYSRPIQPRPIAKRDDIMGGWRNFPST